MMCSDHGGRGRWKTTLRSLGVALQEIHYKASFPHIPSSLSPFLFSFFRGKKKKGLPNANWNLHLKD